MFDDPLPLAPPVKPVPAGTAQLYVVPAGTVPFTPSTGVRENVPPLQIAAFMEVITGEGFKVMVTVKVAPSQPPADGVTIYVIV